MLQVPDLDNITYEQLLENAIHKIPQLTKEWTDFNVHDPGITTLEIHAWLVDMLNYYINASGDIHTYKYLKLLGITPDKCKAAKAWVSMEPAEGNIEIPAGFPVFAGNKCFVSEKKCNVSRNRFLGLYRKKKATVSELTDFVGRGGQYVKVFDPLFEGEETVYFKFEKPLTDHIELFVTVKEQNYCKNLTDDFQLSSPVFQYYSGGDWKRAKIAADYTNGLLRSGILCLELEEEMCDFHSEELNGYLLRISLEENQYDTAPEIGGIYLNPVRMVQKKNLAGRKEYTLFAGEHEIFMDEYISDDETILIGIKDDESGWWRLSDGQNDKNPSFYNVNRDKRKIVFDRSFVSEKDVSVDVFLIKDSMAGLLDIGITDGCADQEYEVSVDHLYEAELLIGNVIDGCLVYQKWEYVDELEKASGRDKVFTWDETQGVIRFGDGVHGMIPEEGSRIRLAVLSVSDFEEGNVRAGEIRIVNDNKYSNVYVHNLEAAKGGKRTETLEEMQKRLEVQIQEQRRLVSSTDYETLVMQIPGLRIKAAKVIPAAEYCDSHGLTAQPFDVWLVICPENQKRNSNLSRQYEEAVLRSMEPYRMLGSRIRVAAPSYTGIQISGKIRITADKVQAERKIKEFLSDYVKQYEDNCSFGAVISHGDIFMKLETLDCVEKVEELHLAPGGKSAVRNDRGDILLNSDCLPYVGEIIFELNNYRY